MKMKDGGPLREIVDDADFWYNVDFDWGEPDPTFGSRIARVDDRYTVIDFGSDPDRYAVVVNYGCDDEQTVLVAETTAACWRFLG